MRSLGPVLLTALVLVRPSMAAGQDPPPVARPAAEDHSAHHPAPAELPPGIPPVTDADRAAAFPEVHGHSVHDRALNYLVRFDQFEGWFTPTRGFTWDGHAWIGTDRTRLWFRTEGDSDAERQVHALYGRHIARWWDVVAGVRMDVLPGPTQGWAAIGVQGLAAYWFDVEATAYVGAGGRTHFRFEGEYEVLVTNRLILQPLLEVEVYGKDDPARQLGAGLSSADTGLRLRYEFRREFAPYVGVSWSRKFFGTADRMRAAGAPPASRRLVAGLRWWL